MNFIERRTLVKWLGVGACATLLPSAKAALASGDLIFASAYRDANGHHGIAILREDGKKLFHIPLPDQGHDVVFSQDLNWGVGFARGPGNFALAFDPQNKRKSIVFHTPHNRHFYGHGVFSADGKLLYASENDFEHSTGVIGIYDATDGFKRIGEIWAGGTGSHDVILMPDQKTLVVANGGIDTHPDFGRTKLNVDTMISSIIAIDIASGAATGVYKLPEELNKISLRHLTVDSKGTIWIAGQKEGAQVRLDKLPLIFKIKQGEDIEEILLPPEINAGFSGYVGSIKACKDDYIVATSPKGNHLVKFSSNDPSKIEVKNIPRVCGIAQTGEGYIASTEHGLWIHENQEIEFDGHSWANHIEVAKL